MKKIILRKGFTLVECVVAMAVLAIMSLILMMILTVTINARNNNTSIERDIDRQIDLLAGTAADTVAYTSQIVFSEGTFTEVIPAKGELDPSGQPHNIEAEKYYDSAADAALGALKYDFSNYKKFKEIETGGGTGNPAPPVTGTGKIYGSEASTIQIDQTVTAVSLGKTVQWTISYSSSVANAKEMSVKIVLPVGFYGVTFGGTSKNDMLMISDDTVRIQSGDASVNAVITFNISDDDFTAYGEYLDKYFNNGPGTGGTISVTL